MPQLKRGRRSSSRSTRLRPAPASCREREDISYFVTHPCHPPVFDDEDDPAGARRLLRRQQGEAADRLRARCRGPRPTTPAASALARDFFAPVTRAHRITRRADGDARAGHGGDDAAPRLSVIREALDEAIRRGVPAEAARDFLMGHINIQLAIFFGEIDAPLSDGRPEDAGRGAARPSSKPDWKKVFEPEAVRAQLESILKPPAE